MLFEGGLRHQLLSPCHSNSNVFRDPNAILRLSVFRTDFLVPKKLVSAAESFLKSASLYVQAGLVRSPAPIISKSFSASSKSALSRSKCHFFSPEKLAARRVMTWNGTLYAAAW